MLSHLLELRRRLLWIFAFFIIFFTLFYLKADLLFHTLIKPLAHALPVNQTLITTQLTAPLFIPITLAADAAIVITGPFILYHIWQFAAPGLYGHERRGLGLAMMISLFLFLAGVLFCFYLVLPYMFQLIVHSTNANVRLMPDMTNTIDFIARMLLIFGFCFQVPLLCVTLVKLQIIDLPGLQKARPYSIVLAFIIGMILTPPDVLSQILLAIPLCLLFEGGVLLVRISQY